MNLRRSRLLPHDDQLFHVSYDQIKSHHLKIVTRLAYFRRRGDKREAKKQTLKASALWNQIMISNECSRLVCQINQKLFTLFNVFRSKFILVPVREV